MIKKLKMWFWNKNKTLNEIMKIKEIADLNIKEILSKLESLQQDKMYVCLIPGATTKELMTVKEAFERAKTKLRWTAPKVLFLNQELKLMTAKEQEVVIKLNKKFKRSV